MRTMHDRCLVNQQLAKVGKDSQVNVLYGVHCRNLGVNSVVEGSMVLGHSVSQSSENLHSRTQTVEGGRCVHERRKTCGYEAKLDIVVDMSASCSPSQATENDDIQRNSKDIYNGQLCFGCFPDIKEKPSYICRNKRERSS